MMFGTYSSQHIVMNISRETSQFFREAYFILYFLKVFSFSDLAGVLISYYYQSTCWVLMFPWKLYFPGKSIVAKTVTTFELEMLVSVALQAKVRDPTFIKYFPGSNCTFIRVFISHKWLLLLQLSSSKQLQ